MLQWKEDLCNRWYLPWKSGWWRGYWAGWWCLEPSSSEPWCPFWTQISRLPDQHHAHQVSTSTWECAEDGSVDTPRQEGSERAWEAGKNRDRAYLIVMQQKLDNDANVLVKILDSCSPHDVSGVLLVWIGCCFVSHNDYSLSIHQLA